VKILFSKTIVLFLLFSSFVKAEALIGLDYILFTDINTVESDTSATSSKSMYLFNVQFSINSKKNLRIGWALYSVTTSDEVNNQQSNYATQDMGPSIRYEFGRSGLYYVNFVYGIQVKTTYDSGSTSQTWLGTNYLAQVGVAPEISDSFAVNFAFNFFNGAAITKVVTTTQTDVSYSKAFMTPTVGLTYKW
jgi:hypothetical protein